MGDNDIASHFTGIGYLSLSTDTQVTLHIKVYYSSTCPGTILSSNAIVRGNKKFTSWSQSSHLDLGLATVQFFNYQNPLSCITITLHMHNSLWFTQQPYLQMRKDETTINMGYIEAYTGDTIIHKLNKTTEYGLWHQQLMHIGANCMDILH